MTAITDKKLRDKTLKEKKGELKKTTKLIKQNTYEKKNNKDTMPEASISNKKNKNNEEPIQRFDGFKRDRQIKSVLQGHVNSANRRTGTQHTHFLHYIKHAIVRATLRELADWKTNLKLNMEGHQKWKHSYSSRNGRIRIEQI